MLEEMPILISLNLFLEIEFLSMRDIQTNKGATQLMDTIVVNTVITM